MTHKHTTDAPPPYPSGPTSIFAAIARERETRYLVNLYCPTCRGATTHALAGHTLTGDEYRCTRCQTVREVKDV